MRSYPKKCCVLALLLLLLFSSNASAQSGKNDPEDKPKNYELSLKPVFITDSDYDGATVGLEFSGKWEKVWLGKSGCKCPSYSMAMVEIEGTLAWEAKYNHDPIRGNVSYGTYYNIVEPRPSIVTLKPKPKVVPQPDLDLGTWGLRFGSGYETDQLGDESNLIIFGQILYLNKIQENFRFLIPSVILSLDQVWVENSDQRDEMPDQGDSFRRLRVLAAWKWKIGEHADGIPGLDWLVPFTLYADLRHFREIYPQDAWQEAGLDESTYFAGALAYEFRDKELQKYLTSVFFRVSTGRIPPETENATNFMVGVTLPGDKLLEALF